MIEKSENKDLILFGTKAKEAVLKGVEKLAMVVKSTLGPKGQNVLFESESSRGLPTFSKDGVGVARRVVKSIINDKFETIGAKAVLGASERALNQSGDGTTSAITLTEVIFKEGLNACEHCNPILLKRALEKVSKDVVKLIKENVLPVNTTSKKDIFNVAMVSSNFDEEISNVVSDIIFNYGKDVEIGIEKSYTGNTYFDKRDGYEIENTGPVSSYFHSVGDANRWVEDGIRVLLSSDKVSSDSNLDEFLNYTLVGQQAKLLIIANDFSTQFITAIVQNVLSNGIQICLVKLKGQEDHCHSILEDLAVLTNTQIFGEKEVCKLCDVKFNMLGIAEKCISQSDKTVITGCKSNKDKVISYVNGLKDRLDSGMDSYNPVKEMRLKDRISKLTNGICNIYIDSMSDAEYQEKKEHYDDTICSCKCSFEGVLPGGGTAFLKVLKPLREKYSFSKTKEEEYAVDILCEALKTPLDTLLTNCGVDKKDREELIEKVISSDKNMGINLNNKELILVDMIKEGIIDASVVPINSLISSVTFAGMLLSTNVCVVNPPEIGIENFM